MVSWRHFPRVTRSWRDLTVDLVKLSCRRYQPRRVSGALPWRVARRSPGSLTVAGVMGGVSCILGGLAGQAVEVWCVYVNVCVGGLGCAGRCWVVPWVRGGWSWAVTGACGGGVLRWVFFWAALVVFSRPVDEDEGRV